MWKFQKHGCQIDQETQQQESHTAAQHTGGHSLSKQGGSKYPITAVENLPITAENHPTSQPHHLKKTSSMQ